MKKLFILAFMALTCGFAFGDPINLGLKTEPEKKLMFEQEGIKIYATTSQCQDQSKTLFQIENQNNTEVKLIMVVNAGSPGLPDMRNITVKPTSILNGNCDTPELLAQSNGALPSIQVTIIH